MSNLIINFGDLKLEIPLEKLAEMGRKNEAKEAVLTMPCQPIIEAEAPPIPKPKRVYANSFEFMARNEILKMKKGGSIFVPTADSRGGSKKFINAAARLRVEGTPCQITTRQTEENGVTGVRVWRMA